MEFNELKASLEIVDSNDDKALKIFISGELNAANVAEFEQYVKDGFNQHQLDLILDFTSLDVLVSSGIGSVLVINDFIKQNQKNMIVNVNKKTKVIFEVAGIDNLIMLGE